MKPFGKKSGPGARIPKLDRLQIWSIVRRFYAGQKQSDLAKAYGVGISTISRIIAKDREERKRCSIDHRGMERQVSQRDSRSLLGRGSHGARPIVENER